jgi:hypothetical protein
MPSWKRMITAAPCGILLAWTSAAIAQDKVGIPVCDDFLAKYDACLSTIERPERRARLQETAAQLRASWIAAAADTTGRANMEQLCATVADGTRKNATMAKCNW